MYMYLHLMQEIYTQVILQLLAEWRAFQVIYAASACIRGIRGLLNATIDLL